MTPITLLEQMLDAIDAIGRNTQNLDQGAFIDDRNTADATFYNLQVVAEAARRLPTDIRERFAHVPWDELSGLRGLLLQERTDENMDMLWPFFKDELGMLYNLVKTVLMVLQGKA